MVAVAFAFLFGALLQIPCDEVKHPTYNGIVKVGGWIEGRSYCHIYLR